MTRAHRILSNTAPWLPALVAGGYFLAAWLAPDACLDAGGSFDYVSWRCSHTQNHPAMDVPAHYLVSFWLLVLALVCALALRGWLRRRGPAA